MKNPLKLSAWSVLVLSVGFSLAPVASAQSLQSWMEQRSKEMEQTIKRAKPVVDQRLEELKRIAEAEANKAAVEAQIQADKAARVAGRAVQKVLYQAAKSGESAKEQVLCSVKSLSVAKLPDGDVPLFSQVVVLDEMTNVSSFDLSADKYRSPWGGTSGSVRISFQYFNLPDGTNITVYKVIPLFAVSDALADVTLEQLGLVTKCQNVPSTVAPTKNPETVLAEEAKGIAETAVQAAQEAAQEMAQ